MGVRRLGGWCTAASWRSNTFPLRPWSTRLLALVGWVAWPDPTVAGGTTVTTVLTSSPGWKAQWRLGEHHVTRGSAGCSQRLPGSHRPNWSGSRWVVIGVAVPGPRYLSRPSSRTSRPLLTRSSEQLAFAAGERSGGAPIPGQAKGSAALANPNELPRAGRDHD